MKQALLLLSLFSALFLSAQNVADLETFEKAMKTGTVLIYDVTQDETKYQLTITLEALGVDAIKYSWKSNAPATAPGTRAGNVHVTANAIKLGDAMAFFHDSNMALYQDQTFPFLSKRTYRDIAERAEADIKMLGLNDTLTRFSNTISEFNFNVNGSLVAVPGLSLEGGSAPKHYIDVVESEKFPLIVRAASFGITLLQLAEVKNQ